MNQYYGWIIYFIGCVFAFIYGCYEAYKVKDEKEVDYSDFPCIVLMSWFTIVMVILNEIKKKVRK